MTRRGESKERLLEVGRTMFLERGYYHCGIEGIVQLAGVPKGSFYHYFLSKEDFGLQVIDRFAADGDAELDRTLGNRVLLPLQRVRSYFEGVIQRYERNESRSGCLVGKLGQELADQSEAFRERIESILDRWVGRLAACLEEARATGAIPDGDDARTIASFWMNAWQGSILRAKTARSAEPLRLFVRMTLDSLENAARSACPTRP